MDVHSSPYLTHYSLDSALENVDHDLIYDPISKQLCIRNKETNFQSKNTCLDNHIEENNIKHIDGPKDLETNSTESSNNILEKHSDNISLSSLKSTLDAATQYKERNSILKNILNKFNLTTFAHSTSAEDLFFKEEDPNCSLDTLSLSSLSSSNSGACKDSSNNLSVGRRPSNLPPKNEFEERKHIAEFQEILKQAKKKELKEIKIKKKVLTKQILQEDQVRVSIRCWTDEILPCWDTCHITKKARDLWWNGIPSPIRSKVWSIAIGNDLNITEELFRICIERSKEKIWTKQFVCRRSSNPTFSLKNSTKTHRRAISSVSQSAKMPSNSDTFSTKIALMSLDETSECAKYDVQQSDDEEDKNEPVGFLIKLDVSRTFPHLGLFQESGPYHKSLSDILSAYVVYRPDLGYCQGMSFLAAMLLLNLDSVYAAFVAFANLLNNELLLTFYRLNECKMKAVYAYYDHQLKSLFPKLAQHFASVGLTSDLFFVYQVYTIFARSLPLECACRVWDIFLRDGNEFIFRASLGILSMYQEELLGLEFVDLAQFLSQLPDEMEIDKYFQTIASIKLVPPKLSESMGAGKFTNDKSSDLSLLQSSLIRKLFQF